MLNSSATQSVTVAVTTSPRLEFGQPVEFRRIPRSEPNPNLFRRAADILPDGERIIGRAVAGAGVTGLRENAIVVVVNWFDELRRLMAGR